MVSRGFEPLGLLYSPTIFPRLHHKPLGQLTTRKVQDSNLWRFYPQRLAIFCITTLPTFRVSLMGIGMVRFELTTSALSAQRSTTELHSIKTR